jgi:hypothetical protein
VAKPCTVFTLVQALAADELAALELLIALEDASTLAIEEAAGTELGATLASLDIATEAKLLEETIGVLELAGAAELGGVLPPEPPPPPQAVNAIAALRLRTKLVCFIKYLPLLLL